MAAGQQQDDNGKPQQDADKAQSSGADQKSDTTPDEKSGQDDGEKKGGGVGSLLHNPKALVIGAVVIVVLVVGALIIWLNARNYQNTDDAFVDVQIVRVAPQIAGLVTQVTVNDNQRVTAGQPLITIDSADAQTRLAEAQAKTAQAQSQVDNAKVQIGVAEAARDQALADVSAAAAQSENASRDLARYHALQATAPNAVAQQQIDQATSQARTAAAQLEGSKKQAESRAEQVAAAQTQVESGLQQVKAAQSEQQAAGINLGYTHIVAPVDGTVAQKTVAAGNYVQPGAQMLAIVPLHVWITANFKETQLDLMRPGQKVRIKVDACPHADVEGHVDSIQRGAGQAFAILPPENATGNYVKVVQRVPVKIMIDRAPTSCPLGPGMSVEPRVRVR